MNIPNGFSIYRTDGAWGSSWAWSRRNPDGSILHSPRCYDTIYHAIYAANEAWGKETGMSIFQMVLETFLNAFPRSPVERARSQRARADFWNRRQQMLWFRSRYEKGRKADRLWKRGERARIRALTLRSLAERNEAL